MPDTTRDMLAEAGDKLVSMGHGDALLNVGVFFRSLGHHIETLDLFHPLQLSARQAARDLLDSLPVSPVGADAPSSPSEPTDLEIAEQGARALADGGQVGHIPTVVGILLDEYDRRGQVIAERQSVTVRPSKEDNR